MLGFQVVLISLKHKKTICILFFSPMHATRPAHITLRNWITWMLFGEMCPKYLRKFLKEMSGKYTEEAAKDELIHSTEIYVNEMPHVVLAKLIK